MLTWLRRGLGWWTTLRLATLGGPNMRDGIRSYVKPNARGLPFWHVVALWIGRVFAILGSP